MTIFEYLEKYHGTTVYTDEYGNTYLDGSREIEEIIRGIVEMDTDPTTGITTYLLPQEVNEKYSGIEIRIADEIKNGVEYVRRPYYRMRGVPVTREQAFELIRRTDNFFREIDCIRKKDEFIGCINFDNWLIEKNHYPQGYGWIHADGTVGTNGITQKHPTIDEFVVEWYQKLLAFPYLNLIIAVTAWNEGPDFDEVLEFDREVQLGIYVHDRQLEILNKWDTMAKYKEYDERYGTQAEKFEPDYYEKHKITQVDLPYLKKCIEAYGLDADKELGKVPEYIWRERESPEGHNLR